MTTQREPDLLDHLNASISRHRHALAPCAMALGMLAFAWAGNRWLTSLAVIATCVVLVLGLQGASELPPRHGERLWGVTAWLTIAAWTITATILGPFVHAFGRPIMIWILGFQTVVFGIPWYWHRRIRRGIEVDATIAAWGDGSIVGLKGTTLRGKLASAGQFSAVIEGTRGVVHYAQIEQARNRMASLFGVHAERVTIERGEHEAEALLTVQQEAPVQKAWQPPLEPVSIKDIFEVGFFDDGGPIRWQFFGEGGALDGVVLGVKGAGKSNFLNVLISYVAACFDAVVWIADLKPGAQEHKAWREVADAFAETPEQVDDMYTALWAMLADRGAAEGRKFQPTRERPAIVVFVDESSILFGESTSTDRAERSRHRDVLEARKTRIGEFLAVSRSFGVSDIFATQFGVYSALGNTTIRGHLVAGHAVAFRTAKAKDATLVFPTPGNIDTGRIPRDRPGTGYFDGPEQDRPLLSRVHALADGLRALVIKTWTGRQPEIEPSAVAAGADAYARIRRGAQGSPGVRQAAAEAPEAEAQQGPTKTRVRLTPQESRTLVLEALAEHQDGATVAELARETGRSATIIQSRLHELAALNLVTSRGRRTPVWRAVVPATP